MTREQAINYLISSGFSEEQVSEVVRALTYEPTTKKDLGVDCISRAQTQTEIEMHACRYTIAKERGGMIQVEWSDQLIKVSDAVDIIGNLPSVTPEITLEDVKGYCKPRLLTLITNKLYHELIHHKIKPIEQEPCDKCEVGNPCLYCKHEFEPQESEG